MEIRVNNETAYAYTGGKTFDARQPTVVLIHGGEQDHSGWVLQSRYLAHHGWSVLAADLPGHGRSRGAALTRIEDMADWVVALLDAANVPAAALVGHSMGSLIALDVAARYASRVTRLALIATAFPMRVSPELLDATRTDETRAQAMINVWSHAAYAHYPNLPGPGAWLHGANLRLMQRQKPGVLHADFSACNAYAAGFERAAQIKCPTLLLLGSRDAMTPARAAQDLGKAITGARIKILDGSGHNLMGERPDDVLDALVDFLAK